MTTPEMVMEAMTPEEIERAERFRSVLGTIAAGTLGICIDALVAALGADQTKRDLNQMVNSIVRLYHSFEPGPRDPQ
jgi:hypothetical protein